MISVGNMVNHSEISPRLYNEQGIDAPVLLRHKSADMTAVYRDTRRAEWTEVKLA